VGEHDNPDAVVAVGEVDRGLQTLRDIAVDGVAGLGPVERDDQDVLGSLISASLP
jgi:hypothetical protein